MIFFAGVSSDDVRVVVEHYPIYRLPARKQEQVAVPGRNGDLLFLQDAFDNYIQPYDIYISAEASGLANVMGGVAEWLNAPLGYQRLVDSYTPESFRLASFAGPVDIENVLAKFGRATIEFNCKPQRFLLTGETAITLSASGGTVTNPTAFAALPLIRVNGSGAGNLQIGSTVVQIADIDGYIDLDAETQNAYKGTTNLNNQITAAAFPVLAGGVNTITWTGGITSLQITPRWWTL